MASCWNLVAHPVGNQSMFVRVLVALEVPIDYIDYTDDPTGRAMGYWVR
jgi:hypothetical protein